LIRGIDKSYSEMVEYTERGNRIPPA